MVKKIKKRGLGRVKSKRNSIKSKKSSNKQPNSKKTVIPKFLPLIKIENINKQFHDNEVLKNISFDIKRNEIFGLIGMSGSGKTTLLNLIIGFYDADFGKIYFNHEDKLIDTADNLKLVQRKIGFAPQEPSFYPKLTTLENLEHFGSLYDIPNAVILKNTDALLKLTRLEDSRHVLAGELSFGMQKRLGIICALIHKPEVLILDEPTADLDPILRDDILELMLKIKEKGITVIIASHFLDDMEEICDRVAILRNGKVIKCASVDDIRQSVHSGQQVILKTRSKRYKLFIDKLKINRSLKIKDAVIKNSSLFIDTVFPEKVISRILNMNKSMTDDIIELKINRLNLTDMFKMLEKSR